MQINFYNPPKGGYYRQVIFPATMARVFNNTFAFLYNQ